MSIEQHTVQAILDRVEAARGREPTEEDHAFVDQGMHALAEDTLAACGLSTPDADALQAIEDALCAEAQREGLDGDDHVVRIFRLAAVAGAALRARQGTGSWVIDRMPDAEPFDLSFASGTMRMFVFARAVDVFMYGEARTTVVLLNHDLDADHVDTPVRFMLRAHDAIDPSRMWSRAIAPDPAFEAPDLPRVCLVRDMPTAIRYLGPGLDGRPLPDLELEARASLRTIDPEITPLDGVPSVAVSGDFYATTLLLDHAFLGHLARELGTDALAVAVPSRDALIAARDTDRDALATVAALIHDDAPPTERISPVALLWKDATFHGIVRAAPATARGPGWGLFGTLAVVVAVACAWWAWG